MTRSFLALPALALAALLAPAHAAAPSLDRPSAPDAPPPAASAPGITVTATALTPGGTQVRTYRVGDAVSPCRARPMRGSTAP